MSALSVQLAERANELLKDRAWHPIEPVMRELMKLVPPGMALRRNEVDRRNNFATRLGISPDQVPPRTRAIDTGKQIESGARSLVREFLNGPAFEVYPKQGPTKNKNVRIAHEHRSVKGSHVRNRISVLENENQRLVEVNELLVKQVEGLRSFLAALGHEATARDIAPSLEP